MKHIADTGLLVALLSRRDLHHEWIVTAFRSFAPFVTCEAVLAEAGSFFPNPAGILLLVSRGDVILDPAFNLGEELEVVRILAKKYADRPMDLADACLVRMTEIHTRCQLWTVDRDDFTVYRRNHRHPIRCDFPLA